MNKNINLNSEINSIFNSLASNASKGEVVVKERPAKGSSCKGIINVFSRRDLDREQEDRDTRRFPIRKAVPIVKYAFYPDTYRPERLGSVAIYGENATARYMTIARDSSFFGHRVRSVSIEVGRRPFVDVKLVG